MTVEKILKDRNLRPPYIAPEENVKSVLRALQTEDVGALIVSGDGIHIGGIISERDIVRGLERYGPNMLEHEVRDFMTVDVITCTPKDRIVGVMALMDRHQIRHLPVMQGERFIGIVSIRDIIRHRLSEVQSEADALRDYITHG